jgi:hypothetical protein
MADSPRCAPTHAALRAAVAAARTVHDADARRRALWPPSTPRPDAGSAATRCRPRGRARGPAPRTGRRPSEALDALDREGVGIRPRSSPPTSWPARSTRTCRCCCCRCGSRPQREPQPARPDSSPTTCTWRSTSRAHAAEHDQGVRYWTAWARRRVDPEAVAQAWDPAPRHPGRGRAAWWPRRRPRIVDDAPGGTDGVVSPTSTRSGRGRARPARAPRPADRFVALAYQGDGSSAPQLVRRCPTLVTDRRPDRTSTRSGGRRHVPVDARRLRWLVDFDEAERVLRGAGRPGGTRPDSRTPLLSRQSRAVACRRRWTWTLDGAGGAARRAGNRDGAPPRSWPRAPRRTTPRAHTGDSPQGPDIETLLSGRRQPSHTRTRWQTRRSWRERAGIHPDTCARLPGADRH